MLHFKDIPLYLRQIIDFMSLKGTFISPTDIIKFMLLFFYISFRDYNVYSRLHLPYVTELHQEYETLVDFSYSIYVLSFTCSQ